MQIVFKNGLHLSSTVKEQMLYYYGLSYVV